MSSTSHRWRTAAEVVPASPLAALERVSLAHSALDVWILRSHAATVDACRPFLSAEESARAERFLFERDRRMAVVSRGFRRMALARYAGSDARALRFREGPQGKPFLEDFPQLRFNVTHSGDVVMFAIGRGRELGIDVECTRDDRDLELLARTSFSCREQQDLLSLPVRERTQAFYRCWTQKEAFIKLVGAGMSFPLDAFDVEVNPGRHPALLGLRAHAPYAVPCGMTMLPCPPGYVATLAVHGAPTSLRTFAID